MNFGWKYPGHISNHVGNVAVGLLQCGKKKKKAPGVLETVTLLNITHKCNMLPRVCGGFGLLLMWEVHMYMYTHVHVWYFARSTMHMIWHDRVRTVSACKWCVCCNSWQDLAFKKLLFCCWIYYQCGYINTWDVLLHGACYFKCCLNVEYGREKREHFVQARTFWIGILQVTRRK